MSLACPQISEDELQEALQAAVVCTILAKAGPQRSRVLANLYKDERTHGLAPFPFMEKVYLERILRPDEVRQPVSSPWRLQGGWGLEDGARSRRPIGSRPAAAHAA